MPQFADPQQREEDEAPLTHHAKVGWASGPSFAAQRQPPWDPISGTRPRWTGAVPDPLADMGMDMDMDMGLGRPTASAASAASAAAVHAAPPGGVSRGGAPDLRGRLRALFGEDDEPGADPGQHERWPGQDASAGPRQAGAAPRGSEQDTP